MRILFPMTANILTPGHIQCLKLLSKKGEVFVSLLTKKGLRNYKKEITPWEDRKYILQHFNKKVVPQDSLDPTFNLKKYKCDAIASGDGWEQKELDAIHRLKLKTINIKLRNEKKKKYSSKKIIDEYIRN
jgi:glycerol-3-phosphate cytidylyltransferase-like family protein